MQIKAHRLNEYINPAFEFALHNQSRYLLLYGGAGSGKSVAAAQKQIIRVLQAMQIKKPIRLLCLRKTTPAVRKSAYEEVKSILRRWSLMQIVLENKTQLRLIFPDTSEILFMGIDDPEKLKSIHGIASVWMEEATEFTLDDFRQIDLRLRGHSAHYKQILMTFNPIDQNHWIKKHLLDANAEKFQQSGQFLTCSIQPDIELAAMRSTYRDNQFLDRTYIERLEQLSKEDANYYKIYTLGEWGALEGLIFPDIHIAQDWPDKFERKAYGIDFGFAANPTAVVEVGVIENNLYIRELLYRREMQNRQIADFIIQNIPDADRYPFIADSAEPKSIAELRYLGINCRPADKGKDSVLYGIQKMRQYRIHIEANSVNAIKEFQSYKWAEKPDGTTKDEPVKFNDHIIDAARYALTSLVGRQIKIEFV